MLRLYTAADLPEAYLLVGLLNNEGIPARVFNENAQGALGEIPFTHAYPEIWLEDGRDLERARALVRGFEQRTDAGPTTCGACGESNPGTFEVCWRCGRPLPAAGDDE